MDWEDAPVKVNQKNIRTFANMDDSGAPADKPVTPATGMYLPTKESLDAKIAELEAQKAQLDGWEDAPVKGAQSKSSGTASNTDGWEDAPKKETSFVDNLKGFGTGLTDIVGGIPGFVFGTAHGVVTGVEKGSAKEGLKAAEEFMHAATPSQIAKKAFDIDMPTNNAGYNLAMTPLDWLDKGLSYSAKGYGEIAKAAGAKDSTAEEIQSAVKLGLLSGMAATGARGKEATPSPETLRMMQDAQQHVEPTLPQEPPAPPLGPTDAHANDYAAMNPYDVGGHVSAIDQGRVTTIDGFQPDFFENAEALPKDIERPQPLPQLDMQGVPPAAPEVASPHGETGYPPLYSMDDVPLIDEAIKRFRDEKGNVSVEKALPEIDKMLGRDPLDVGLADHPVDDGGVRHLDPDTGNVVQGMAKEVPTVESLLKMEVIDKDPRITEMRQYIEEQRRFNDEVKQSGASAERIAALDQSLHHLENEFGRYMEESYGVKTPQDITMAKVIEHGGDTKLPIQQTYDARSQGGMGRFKKQGGSINTKEIKEGLGSIMDRLRKQNESSKIMGDSDERAKAPIKPLDQFKPKNKQQGSIDLGALFRRKSLEEVGLPQKIAEMVNHQTVEPERISGDVHTAVEALKDSAVGKGLEDFKMPDRTPAEVVEMVKKFPDIDRKPIQENIENGSIYRAIDTKHPLVQAVSTWLDRAQQSSVEFTRKYLTDPVSGYKGFMRRLTPEQKARIWNEIIMNEGKQILSEAELRDRGYTPDEIAFYQYHTALNKMLYKLFNKTREMLGLPPVDERIGHVFGRFVGDFRVRAQRVILDKDGNPKINPDGSLATELIGFVGGNTKWDVARTMKKVQEMHPDWKFDDKIEYKPLTNGKTVESRFDGLLGALDIISKDNPHMKDLVDAYVGIAKQDAAKMFNAQRHALDKKAAPGGLLGSEGNKAWESLKKNADDGMKAQLAAAEQMFGWVETQKAVKNIMDVIKDPAVVEKAPNAADWANMQIDHVLGRNGGAFADVANKVIDAVGEGLGVGRSNIIKVSNATKGLMMQKFLGFFNVPFTMVQLLQPIQTVPPMMALFAARGVDLASLSMSGLKSTWTMMRVGMNMAMKNGEIMPFNSFERQALDYAHKYHVFDVQMVDHTHDINASPVREGITALGNVNVKYPEAITRGLAFMSFAHALKDAGYRSHEALQIAERATNVVMRDYTPNARPLVFDKGAWVGDIMSTLQRYKFGEINSMTMYGREGINGLKRGQPQFMIPLATHLALSVAASGIVGMGMYQTADQGYRLLTKLLGKPDSLTDLVLRTPKIGNAMAYGLGSMFGVDMSQRFGSQTLPSGVGDAFVPYGSDVVNMGKATWDYVKNPNTFNAKVLGKSLSPNSTTGLWENHGFTDKDGNYVNPNSDHNLVFKRSPEDMKMRAWGFRPLHESIERQRDFEVQDRSKTYTELRKGLIQDAKTDLLSGDLSPEKIKKYAQKYAEYGSTQFDRDLQQQIMGIKLTEAQRLMIKNAGGSYTGAKNLEHFRQLDKAIGEK